MLPFELIGISRIESPAAVVADLLGFFASVVRTHCTRSHPGSEEEKSCCATGSHRYRWISQSFSYMRRSGAQTNILNLGRIRNWFMETEMKGLGARKQQIFDNRLLYVQWMQSNWPVSAIIMFTLCTWITALQTQRETAVKSSAGGDRTQRTLSVSPFMYSLLACKCGSQNEDIFRIHPQNYTKMQQLILVFINYSTGMALILQSIIP